LTGPKKAPKLSELIIFGFDVNVKDDTVEIPASGVEWDDWSVEYCHNDGTYVSADL
jgi:hypothetical protein